MRLTAGPTSASLTVAGQLVERGDAPAGVAVQAQAGAVRGRVGPVHQRRRVHLLPGQAGVVVGDLAGGDRVVVGRLLREGVGGFAGAVAAHAARDVVGAAHRDGVAGEPVGAVAELEAGGVLSGDRLVPPRRRAVVTGGHREDRREAFRAVVDVGDRRHLHARRHAPVVEAGVAAGGQRGAAIGARLPGALRRRVGFLPDQAGDVVLHGAVAEIGVALVVGDAGAVGDRVGHAPARPLVRSAARLDAGAAGRAADAAAGCAARAGRRSRRPVPLAPPVPAVVPPLPGRAAGAGRAPPAPVAPPVDEPVAPPLPDGVPPPAPVAPPAPLSVPPAPPVAPPAGVITLPAHPAHSRTTAPHSHRVSARSVSCDEVPGS